MSIPAMCKLRRDAQVPLDVVGEGPARGSHRQSARGNPALHARAPAEAWRRTWLDNKRGF